jgi:hypothetical protein
MLAFLHYSAIKWLAERRLEIPALFYIDDNTAAPLLLSDF